MADQENTFLPYTIYKNLEKFLNYRKLDLVQGSIYPNDKSEGFVDFDTLKKNIQYYEYVLLECQDNDQKDRRFTKDISQANKKLPVKTFILLFYTQTEYLATSSDFVKVLKRIPGFDSETRNYNMDIILISHDAINTYLNKKINNLITNGMENNGYKHIYSYKYCVFTMEIPTHELIANHVILTKNREQEILIELNTSKKNLPKIKKNDAVAIWIGAELGDIVKTEHLSEASGVKTVYLVVRV